MPFTDPPPTGSPFAVPVFAPDGTTLLAIEISPVWQNWFATFREGVEQEGVAVGLSLTQLQTELAVLTQDNVDSIGAAIFGEDYKGPWTARTHNVGNVRSYDGKFYKCIVGRTSANTVNPDSDTTGWELIGSAADLGSLSDDNINAIGGASFGGNFQGTWAAGIFAVGGVVYHGGFFYECTVARTAANTDDPSVDAGSWSITSTTDESGDVSQAVQAAIDGAARIEYGERYKEEWSAGAFAIGDVVYHDGIFYECDVARSASDTDAPATDTTGWSPKASSEGGITQAVQNAIDAQAVINFGDKYEGVWAVGAYAIGDVVYFHGDFRGASFYECTQTRTAANTSDPSVNASAWDVKTVTFEIMGDVNVDLTSVVNAIQNAIDAQGTANFGENYEGSWGAGIFAVDRVVYHDGAFYTCIVARAASDTDDPSVDTDSWAVEVSESGGLDAAIQNAIDAQGAIQFGSDYKGAWEAGIFAVGDDVYHDGVFFECDVARDAADTDNPATDTVSWSVKTVEASDASSAVQMAIDAQARIEYGDSYQGTWAAGVFAVGDVAYHDGVFYECDVARAASDTDDPAADTTGWSPKASSEGGITQAVQNAIDAQAAINFGEDYQGTWAAGIFAAGNVVYHGGFFYECDTLPARPRTRITPQPTRQAGHPRFRLRATSPPSKPK